MVMDEVEDMEGEGYNNDVQRDSNYIPNKILENLSPKYKAMMFKGRDVMEADNQDNRKRSAHSASSCSRDLC